MKKVFGIMFLGFVLTSCGPSSTASYDEWKKYNKESGYSYFSQACSASAENYDVYSCGSGASTVSQQLANNKAISNCATAFNDCVVVKENDRTVYSKQDAQQVQLATLIEDSKNTCKSLGFKEGTDKFTECSLKLYTQKVELAEKQNQQVVVQNQGSSTVRVIDVTKEDENYRRRAMGLINGTCTIAQYYSC